jgi:cyclophilin family peptidyl-prolyl cis-trans isomerase
MPSEKRARQREMRQIKINQELKHAKRMKTGRRLLFALVVVGVVIGLVVLLSSGPAKKKSTGNSTTTTTTSPVTAAGIKTSSKTIQPVCPPTGGTSVRYIKFTTAPPNCITATGTYSATVKTDIGTFTINLLNATSSSAVNNFVFLARNRFYDTTTFQRVIPGFVVQGGDPTGTGAGGPGYSWTGNAPNSSCQAKNDCYPLGGVAMANSGTPTSNQSQFFIITGAQGEQLAPNYTLFGQVTSGMSVVQQISADGNADPSSDGVPPKVTHHIVSVTIH